MKYSITIPAYKSRFFRECLESVLAQTYNDYEIIILNDCSPENIKDIVDEFYSHKNGKKIRYYENEKNVGAIDVVDNWNKLLELSRGEYIVCMGDDDKLSSDFLQQYETLMEEHPDLDVYHSRTYIIDENSKIINIQEARPNWESAYSIAWHAFLSHRIQFIGDFLFRREKLIKIGGFYNLPMARGSDWVSGILCSKETGIANGQKPTFFYRESCSTITYSTDGEILVDADIKLRESIFDFLKEIPSDDVDKEYRRFLLNRLPDNLRRTLIKTVSRDIAHSSLKKWFYWNNKRKKYGIKSRDYLIITTYAFLYFFKRITGIKG